MGFAREAGRRRKVLAYAAAAALVAALPATAPCAAPGVSAGQSHSCAVDTRGAAFCWGANSEGQLGNGQIGAELKVDVAGVAGAIAVEGGWNHSCAIVPGGTVKCWGGNDFGQLGDGTTASHSEPREVVGLPPAVEIALADNYSCALTVAGAVKCWGQNFGNLGSGGYDDRTRPVDVIGLQGGIVHVVAAARHACAIGSSGEVKCWGDNFYGQLGDGTQVARTRAVDVASLGGAAVGLAAGSTHTCALLNTGAIRCWGDNQSGQLGDGTTTSRLLPVDVIGLDTPARAVAAKGNRGTCAIVSIDRVKCWGGFEHLELDSQVIHPTPVEVRAVAGIAASIAAGGEHFCVITLEGAMVCWGANGDGQLGNAASRDGVGPPIQVADLGGVAVGMGLGSFHTCAILYPGAVRCWGSNRQGQLGTDPARNNIAVRVGNLDNAVAIGASGNYSCALIATGGVKCWGSNVYGQLGDGSRADRATAGDVIGLAGATDLSLGAIYACAIVAGGSVQCWGNGRASPAPVDGLGSGVTAIATGTQHACAIVAGGAVRCWGLNDHGQLGDGSTTSYGPAVTVAGFSSGAIAVAAARTHSCAATASEVKCWGANDVGQLGNGTNSDSPTPVSVLGLPGPVSALVASHEGTCALTRSGGVWCWGGYLADAITRRTAYAPSNTLTSGVRAIALGESHACAILDGGGVNCLGANSNGQLGDGSLVYERARPESVVAADGRTFLDLTVEDPLIPDKLSPFVVVARGGGGNVQADMQFRAGDIGSSGSVFVFAVAPENVLRGVVAKDARFAWKARGAAKESPVACALAQLNAQGQLVAVSAASLRAYVSGVLSAQGQAINVLSAVNTSDVAGATFYVGYGADGSSMLVNGTTRSVVNVSGSVNCVPQAPRTGWWYNPDEGGRGFSIEARGNRLFFAAFHYDDSGRATWNFAGGATSLDGSLFTNTFLVATGGQTLTGPYRAPGVASAGALTLVFSDASHGTMFWPGGNVAIERQPFVPEGLTAPPQPGLPEPGWWWNPGESGRGFFIEWQNGSVDIAGYMYDDAGRPTWYIASYPTPDPLLISGSWWTYAGGQSMGGPYKLPTRTSDNAGSLRVEFSGPATATMTLPDGRRIPLVRQSF